KKLRVLRAFAVRFEAKSFDADQVVTEHSKMRWFAICVALVAVQARADGTADEADLQFRLGTQEFQRGNYEAALEHFFVSNRLAPNANVLYNIGSAFERQKRWADAHRYYFDALNGETDPAGIKADR